MIREFSGTGGKKSDRSFDADGARADRNGAKAFTPFRQCRDH